MLPVPPPRSVDRRSAAVAMLLAPAVGVGLGLVAGVVLLAAGALGAPPLLAAVAALVVLTVATRALHLDGLADTADGLGSTRLGVAALAVMKRSDIGPFGVVTVVLALLTDVTALAARTAQSPAAGAGTLLVAVVAGRTALPLLTRRGVPAASSDGLGASVASSVPAGGAAAVVIAAALCALSRSPGPLVGLVAAEVLLRRVRRGWGGITGDVLGAAVETSTAVCLAVLALRRLAWG